MKLKRMLLLAACLMLFGAVCIVGAIRSVNRIPELLKPNTQWVCEDHDAWFYIDDEGSMEGKVTIDGAEQLFCIHYREGYAVFYHCAEEDTYKGDAESNIFWRASLRARGGDLHFYITEDSWEAGVDKLVFVRN